MKKSKKQAMQVVFKQDWMMLPRRDHCCECTNCDATKVSNGQITIVPHTTRILCNMHLLIEPKKTS